MNNKAIVKFIRFLHILVVLAVIVTPFSSNQEILEGYAVLIPFLFFHWATNDDTCALTLLEQKLRGKKDRKDTFFGSFFNPIYKPPEDVIGIFTKAVTFFLWLFVMIKIKLNYISKCR